MTGVTRWDTPERRTGHPPDRYRDAQPSAPLRNTLDRLANLRLLLVNWRDIRHPEAGGAERYLHEIATRWVSSGARVTLLTARAAGRPARETIDGIDVRRAGGALSVYPLTAARMLAHRGRVDAVVDCQNGIPFFAPVVLGAATPVVQVVHHVHQDQFGTRFPPALAAFGRALEGPVASRVYRQHRSAAVSPSTRQEMRERLGFDGVVDIVPNGGSGSVWPATARAADPTIVVVTRLVAHKRIDLLLRAVAALRAALPRVRLDVVGTGPEGPALLALASRLALGESVTFHGRVDDATRNELLGRAWLTTSTSAGEGWGLSVMEAAAAGLPCVALRAPGIRDSVADGRTGWLVDAPGALPEALRVAIAQLTDGANAAAWSARCRAWASCFTWDRSAQLLAATVLAEIDRVRHPAVTRRRGSRTRLRSDLSTVAYCTHPDPARLAGMLRLTDEVAADGTSVTALLRGCDDLSAVRLLDSLGATDIAVRPADRHEVLGGPAVVDAADDREIRTCRT